MPGPWFQNSGTKSANTSRQHLQPWAARRAEGASSGAPVKEGRLDGLFGGVGGIRNVRTECLSEWIGARDREAGRLLGEKSASPFPSPCSHLSSEADSLSEPPASHLPYFNNERSRAHIPAFTARALQCPDSPRGSANIWIKRSPPPPLPLRGRGVFGVGAPGRVCAFLARKDLPAQSQKGSFWGRGGEVPLDVRKAPAERAWGSPFC